MNRMQQALVESKSTTPVPPTMSSGRPGVHVAAPDRLLADLIHDVPAEAEEAEKSQQVLEASHALTAEADEAERVVELLDVTRPVLGEEAEDQEKAASLLAPPGPPPPDDEG